MRAMHALFWAQKARGQVLNMVHSCVGHGMAQHPSSSPSPSLQITAQVRYDRGCAVRCVKARKRPPAQRFCFQWSVPSTSN
eukprot:395821-Amphidinium_carterae.1